MQKLPLHEYRNTSPIAAGRNEPFSVVPSNFFYVDTATHPNFRLVLNDDVTVSGRLARGHIFPENFVIEKIRVENTDASRPLQITFTVGRGRPIDEGLNVYTEQVTPIVRQQNPSGYAIVPLACTGLGNSLEFLAADCERAEVWLFTNDVGTAFFGPDSTTIWPTHNGNQVGLSLEGATKLRTCAPIYVRGEVGTIVYAHVFTY